MDIPKSIAALSGDEAKDALSRILTAFTSPAFGTLPKREIDLMVFTEMTRLGIVSPKASAYELMVGLRVARAKANSLVFDRDLRAHEVGDLDAAITEALANARFAKDGDYFVLEEDNPLLHATLKDRLKRLGHISDTSFNTALIRMSPDAATALTVDLMPKDGREEVRRALVKAGAPDESLHGTVKRALIAVRDKVKDGAVDMAADFGKEHVKLLIAANAPAILHAFQTLMG